MLNESLTREVEEMLSETPVLDPHTHLIDGKLGARGLQDVLLYHMVISDLYSAGCPTGHRLTEYPGWPTDEESHKRIQEALPHLPYIRNTSGAWGLRIILRDLYGCDELPTVDNWRRLDQLIKERADHQAWQYEILDRANVKRNGTEIARRTNGRDDMRLQYSLEWGFFTRTQWGEYDTALYELERCWSNPAGSPAPIGGSRAHVNREIRSLDDVHAAMRHYIESFPFDQLIATATGISTDIDYQPVTQEAMSDALKRRRSAGATERDIYASYILELLLSELERYGDRIVFQFSLGAEPLPFETASRLTQRTIGQLAETIARHPGLRFQCLLSSRHANQSLCTLARELPNFSLVGYWWHNFFPDVIRQVIAERLDMLPTNKQIGFFSDAYCVEWVYAKVMLVRKQIAHVLALKIQQGQYSLADAQSIARAILFESPQTLLGMKPISSYVHTSSRHSCA